MLQRLRFWRKASHPQRPIYFALDLDGTLVTLPPGPCSEHHKIIPIQHPLGPITINYYLIHGAEEFVKALSMIAGARITFYSAGKKWRNDQLTRIFMKQIDKRWPGKTSFQVISTELGVKDLREMGRDVDLDAAILVDDNAPVPAEQCENLVRLHSNLMSDGASGYSHVVADNNELVRAAGIIFEALDVAASMKISLKRAVYAVQAAVPLDRTGERLRALYERGLRELRKYNAAFTLV